MQPFVCRQSWLVSSAFLGHPVADPRDIHMLGRVRAAAAAAREAGSLKSYATELELLPAAEGAEFEVRVLRSLREKDAASKRDPTVPAGPEKGKFFNPFLPYDPTMFVQDLAPAHVLLLNKFNVMEDHALIVTRAFEDQSSLLTAADFTAMWACLNSLSGLAFYNAGACAGASQRHKHLQIIPSVKPPFSAVLNAALPPPGKLFSAPLPFAHAAASMQDIAAMDSVAAGAATFQRYMEMLHALGRADIWGIGQAEKNGRPYAYNLLATSDWMLLVPRSKESFEGVSINALGFAGYLLVRDEEALVRVRGVGPWAILKEVGFARELWD